MTKSELAQEIYKYSHLTGEFTLRSGTISNEYFDKYQFESLPHLLDEISNQMISLLPDNFDYLAGLEMGGIPIASAISMKIGKPVVFVRKESKKYGTAKLAEGPEISGKNLVIIEDVVTSGGQIVISANDLRERGAKISKAVCVIDREAGGDSNLRDVGIELSPLMTMSYIKAQM